MLRRRTLGPVWFDLRLLPAFVAVADELHFGRAAERLHLAQPALSQQIRRLEAQLGVRLLERNARGVDLTPAGTALLPEARAALDAAQRGADAARSAAAGQHAILRLSVDLDIPARVLGRVRSFADQRADVSLRIVRQHQGDALAALHEGQVDVVLGWGRMPYGRPVRSLVVDAVQIVAVLRRDHPDAARPVMPREVFARHRFVLFQREPSTDVFDWLVQAATGQQPEQSLVEQVPSLDSGTTEMLRAAMQGPGMTLAAADHVPEADPELTAIPFEPPLRHDVLLLWAPAAESAAVRAFAAHCAPGAWP